MQNLVFDNISDFKKYIDSSKKTDFSLDITGMNIFDGLKFTVLSSEYFYRKHPAEKLKCKISNDMKSLISSFNVSNLEFV